MAIIKLFMDQSEESILPLGYKTGSVKAIQQALLQDMNSRNSFDHH